jgi:hypothetical protein
MICINTDCLSCGKFIIDDSAEMFTFAACVISCLMFKIILSVSLKGMLFRLTDKIVSSYIFSI